MKRSKIAWWICIGMAVLGIALGHTSAGVMPWLAASFVILCLSRD